jgi:2-aminoethylphosphonate-pyruvate transaminase
VAGPMLLLTPGHASTDPTVRRAMTRELGGEGRAVSALTARVRRRIVRLVSRDADKWTCVPLQGDGTFAVESMIGSLVPTSGHLAVLVNGASGARMVQIAERAGRRVTAIVSRSEAACDVAALERLLSNDPTVTHVAVAHCEADTGLVNPLAEVAAACRGHQAGLLVDAGATLGALRILADDLDLVALSAASGGCLEGPRGLGLVVCRRDALQQARGHVASLSLDLKAQSARFDLDGQWRFGASIPLLLGLDRALDLLIEEGGPTGRRARYGENHAVLVEGMVALGFHMLLPDPLQSPLIATFEAPSTPGWSFVQFRRALAEHRFWISAGALPHSETFRVACVGQVYPLDMERFVGAVADVVRQMGLGPHLLAADTPESTVSTGASRPTPSATPVLGLRASAAARLLESLPPPPELSARGSARIAP